MSESLKQKTIKGATWTAIERVANQTASFVISIVLARLLMPSDYGVIGMLTVFISIAGTLVNSGFATALIQKKDRTDVDFSTAFWFNLVLSLIFYGILFFAAPWIAEFYRMPELKLIMRVLGLVLIVNALYTVQVARLTALIDFKTQAKISFLSCVLTGLFGIALAYCGCGPWTIVSQQLFSGVFGGVMYWILSGWRPQFLFSIQSFKRLFGFGSKLMVSSLLHTIYANISPLIVGRKFSSSVLGVYSRADTLAQYPEGIFQSIFGRVIFPVFSSIQDDDERLRNAYTKYLRLITSLIAPSMLIMAAVSEPLILTLIGSRWVACVPYVMVLSIGLMVDPISTVNLNMIYVKGRSDIVLKLEVIKKVIAIAIVLVSVQFGVIWLCVGRAVYGYVAMALNVSASTPLIGLGFWRQLNDVWRIYAVSIVSAVAAFATNLFLSHYGFGGDAWGCCAVRLVLSSVVGCGLYVLLANLFGFEIIAEGKQAVAKIKGRFRR